MDLDKYKGIGPKTKDLLNNLGIYTIDDMARNYPYRFDVLVNRNINDEKYYDNMTVEAVVESNPVVNFFKGKLNRLSFRCLVQNKIIKVVIFNRAFMKKNITIGKTVTLIGSIIPSQKLLRVLTFYYMHYLVACK